MALTMSLTFQVTRKNPELIRPAVPTPHEFKPLSDIDGQVNLRFQVPLIQFYRCNPSMKGKDPSKVIREAISKALVFYYPFDGRLRESAAARKLVVECTGEGVVFVEAEADVTLQQFGDALCPPIPCLEELLHDVPGTAEIINCPLLLAQVTRLKCSGFTFALRFNHTMSDATGIIQLMSAVREFARSAKAPSIPPVWERHLLSACRQPPHVTGSHNEYQVVRPGAEITLFPHNDYVHRSFFFRASDISDLRSTLPPQFRSCTKFELLAACVWRCRTIALSLDHDEEVEFYCMVNFRNHFNPPLPKGYYGNAIVYPIATSTAGKLSTGPLHYALELVRNAKSEVTEEYIKSMIDLVTKRGGSSFKVANTYMVSDLRNMGFDEVDYGWGKGAYGGPATSGKDRIPGIVSFFLPFIDNNGEKGVVVPMCLPLKAMEVFEKELKATMLGE